MTNFEKSQVITSINTYFCWSYQHNKVEIQLIQDIVQIFLFYELTLTQTGHFFPAPTSQPGSQYCYVEYDNRLSTNKINIFCHLMRQN